MKSPARSPLPLLLVAAAAIAVYLGALSNGYALDDVPIIATNPVVHRWSTLWEAFGQPYWPPAWGAAMYRPLAIIAYAVDWRAGVVWLHAVNLLWHAAVSILVAALTRRWTGSDMASLVAGLLFALHPVHVEAVANIVGRAELMATLFVVLSVLAALEYDCLGWSMVALALGLLSKETAATVPALVAAGWVAGVGRRPSTRRKLAYVGSWVGLGVVYVAVRWTILHPYVEQQQLAPVFLGASFPATRMTAVAAIADFARLLFFPLTLRVDYSPGERTLVTSPFDVRLILGVICLVGWAVLIGWAWRRGRRHEAFALSWIGISLLPVANLLFPIGVLVAERTLYLPSVGLCLAVGFWIRGVAARPLAWAAAVVLAACGVRTALRVPVWSSTVRVASSVSRDSPRSYVGPMWRAGAALAAHRPADALAGVRAAVAITDRAPRLLLLGADAALTLGRPVVADSFLARLDQLCRQCSFHYKNEARAAVQRGDTAIARELLARARKLERDAGNGWRVRKSGTTRRGALR